MQKNYGPYFSSLNSVLASVGAPLGYRMSYEGIGRLRNAIFYDFRQVHLLSLENVKLSRYKMHDDYIAGNV